MFHSGYSTNTKSVPTYGRRGKAVVRVHRDVVASPAPSPLPKPPQRAASVVVPPFALDGKTAQTDYDDEEDAELATTPLASPIKPVHRALKQIAAGGGSGRSSPFGSPLRRPSALADKTRRLRPVMGTQAVISSKETREQWTDDEAAGHEQDENVPLKATTAGANKASKSKSGGLAPSKSSVVVVDKGAAGGKAEVAPGSLVGARRPLTRRSTKVGGRPAGLPRETSLDRLPLAGSLAAVPTVEKRTTRASSVEPSAPVAVAPSRRTEWPTASRLSSFSRRSASSREPTPVPAPIRAIASLQTAAGNQADGDFGDESLLIIEQPSLLDEPTDDEGASAVAAADDSNLASALAAVTLEPSRRSTPPAASTSSATATAALISRASRSKRSPASSPLAGLLAACDQAEPLSFADFLSSAVLLNPAHSASGIPSSTSGPAVGRYVKVGEATYSEVFAVYPASAPLRPTRTGTRRLTPDPPSSSSTSSDVSAEPAVVLKVIPLLQTLDNTRCQAAARPAANESQPEVSLADDVAREIGLGRLVGGLEGFLALNSAVVVKGGYPAPLLAEWDAYKHTHPSKSQNAHPALFGPEQLYAVLLLPYGGTDLESFRWSRTEGWAQAAGVFFAVAGALARAEAELEFEHRDLHLGQILVKPSSAPTIFPSIFSTDEPTPSTGPFDRGTGLDCAIIDLGLSRVRRPTDGAVWWTAFEAAHFEGTGTQADVYREMRNLLGADLTRWDAYAPRSNLLWLAYLARTLKPTARAPAKTRPRELAAYSALQATLRMLKAGDGEAADLAGAGALVDWAQGNGWCS